MGTVQGTHSRWATASRLPTWPGSSAWTGRTRGSRRRRPELSSAGCGGTVPTT
jgi:hypothetical protein